MADPIDELVQRWKQSPSSSATIALCDALRGSARAALVLQIGEFSAQRHANDIGVMLAIARMYVAGGRLSEAQAVLVAAGKIAPREPDVYRWLGEVLVRRGDAERGEKVLERALQLGTREPDARLWLERARVFRPMQAKAGTRAVAAEVAHAASMQGALGAAPPRAAMDSYNDTTTMVRQMPPQKGEASRSDYASPPNDSQTHAIQTHASQTQDSGDDHVSELAQTKQRPSARSAPAMLPPEPRQSDSDLETAVLDMQRPLTGPQHPPFGDEADAPVFSQDAETAQAFSPLSPPPFQRPPSVEVDISVQLPLPRDPASPPPPPPQAPPAPRRSSSNRPPPAAPPFGAGVNPFDALAPARAAAGRPPSAPPERAATPRASEENGLTPHPRDVLDALALAGVFEPPSAAGAPLRWDRPEGQKRRWRASTFVSVLTVLVVGAGIFGFFQVKKKRAREHAQAETILAKVESDLQSSKPSLLPDVEKSIAQTFELESRSPRASLDWLHERGMLGLLTGGADVSFDEAMTRGRDTGVADTDMAFALVASFLFQKDLGGAAALFPKWDAPAGKDPWYELMSGATLERAGDGRARERYAAAAQLDPQLLVAQIALARSEAMDGDPQHAAELAKQFRDAHPDRAEGAALVALAWAVMGARADQTPPEVDDAIARAPELPIALAFVPPAIGAIRALDKHANDDAKAQIQKALMVVDSPGAATWIGNLALATGDDQLARKAAIAAVGFSALYLPARILAARVALLGARLDDAINATKDLPPELPGVAIVRAAVAYERLDVDALSRALDVLPPETRKDESLSALVLALNVVGGRAQVPSAKILTLAAASDVPWSELVAMDLALDLGDMRTADKIAATWKDTETMPLRAVRLARLARYENRLDDGAALADFSLKGTMDATGRLGAPRAVLENAFLAVAKGDSAGLAHTLGAYSDAIGPLATWLSAYGAAASGKIDDAKGKVSAIDPPPTTAPLENRIVVAAALGAMKDKKRGVEYVALLLASGIQNPDVVDAALALGFKKVDHADGTSTYEP